MRAGSGQWSCITDRHDGATGHTTNSTNHLCALALSTPNVFRKFIASSSSLSPQCANTLGAAGHGMSGRFCGAFPLDIEVKGWNACPTRIQVSENHDHGCNVRIGKSVSLIWGIPSCLTPDPIRPIHYEHVILVVAMTAVPRASIGATDPCELLRLCPSILFCYCIQSYHKHHYAVTLVLSLTFSIIEVQVEGST